MNLIAWLLGLSILILLMAQAVAFHKATVCRQEAWLKSTEMKTRTLLTEVKPYARDWHLSCRILVLRSQNQLTWQRLPRLTRHQFVIPLKGKL